MDYLIIKPHLTMAVRNTELHYLQTIAEIPIPVVVPVLSIRHRVALLMRLTSLWLVTISVTVGICLLSMPGIYRFVAVVIVLLIGCLFSSAFVSSKYCERLAVEPRLITQPLSAGDTLEDLEEKVSMDTSRYLAVVKVQ